VTSTSRRIEQCKEFMTQFGFDLMVLAPGPNMYYFSGFTDVPMERMLLLLIPAREAPFFISPELYENQIRKDSYIKDVEIWKEADDPTRLLESVLNKIEFLHSKVLVDDRMWAIFLLPLKEILEDCEFAPASKATSALRIRKSEEEIGNLQQSASIVDAVFEYVVTEMRIEGMTELEVANGIKYAMGKRGGEDTVGVLVASGPNGASPHHCPGDRVINNGDVVILDYGCRFRGYCSDMSRTIICGKPSEEVETLYALVQKAQEKAFQAVQPGISAKEIDQIARGEIAREGFGERFIHRTGHGIGLEVHEEPYIAADNDLKLDQGMTFSIEPGIYFPGHFGIRIEDIVLVTKRGGKRLNRSGHDFKSI